MKYPLTFYVNLKDTLEGKTKGPIVLIREDLKNSAPVYYHELEHARQWWKITLISAIAFLGVLSLADAHLFFAVGSVIPHPTLWLVSRKYREYCEIKAFAAGIRHEDIRERAILRASLNLATNYSLDYKRFSTEYDAANYFEAKLREKI